MEAPQVYHIDCSSSDVASSCNCESRVWRRKSRLLLLQRFLEYSRSILYEELSLTCEISWLYLYVKFWNIQAHTAISKLMVVNTNYYKSSQYNYNQNMTLVSYW